MAKRSPGLIAIVVYKAITAIFLVIISFSLLLAIKKQTQLLQLEDSLTLSGKLGFIAWVLEKILNFNPRTLELSGIAAGVYAAVTTVEALGLWYQKKWASWLVLGLVSISILPEIFELSKGFSILKFLIFLANVGIFIYLLREIRNGK
ncbi:DUF2127 domain-containing protein [Allocoleopsis sp.]|uniref:DUF2127 domain-containing protein n=1 Tax=Allocoleopsis sp. TaxID=3088169 RepID=UPI002FD0F19E